MRLLLPANIWRYAAVGTDLETVIIRAHAPRPASMKWAACLMITITITITILTIDDISSRRGDELSEV